MDSEKVNELLQKYWNCETTLEEERQLQTYFQGAVPDSLKETASLFRYFNAQRNQKISDAAFERSVINKIHPRKGKMPPLFYNSMRIAAGIVVLIMAVWFVRMEVRKSDPVEVADTYDDPKIAFEETKKALMMISRSFNTAEEHAKKINLFNEAQKDIKQEEVPNEL
jgi:hypothetical protein